MLELDRVTTRVAFGETVLELAREDENLFAVGGDSFDSMQLARMQREFPRRAFNLGIAEQNTMGVAAGIASLGFKVVAAGFAPFMSMRAVEQFRSFIAYPELNVTVAGGMGGLSASTEGVTHQGLEDCGIMRQFPNTVVAVPADEASCRVITRALVSADGPAYIRLGKGEFYRVFDEGYRFAIGKANIMQEGSDLTIVSNGAVFVRALRACEALRREGISVHLIEMPCVKPIDEQALTDAAARTGAVLTVEDHSVIGGLGGAVAEVLGERKPVPLKRVGIPDVFPESGSHEALLDRYGLSVETIVREARALLRRKGG